MYSVLIGISVIVSALLIIIILMQASKGSGLAGTFGGANVGSVFGTRRTADFLSKSTWWLAGVLVILAIVVNLFFLPTAKNDNTNSVIQQGGRQSVPTNPALPR
ncbi:MAG: preprotein translocase subunit SecG [Ignavibacteriaceae bacterium]|jgi:preprotein translocase subunit SecG